MIRVTYDYLPFIIAAQRTDILLIRSILLPRQTTVEKLGKPAIFQLGRREEVTTDSLFLSFKDGEGWFWGKPTDPCCNKDGGKTWEFRILTPKLSSQPDHLSVLAPKAEMTTSSSDLHDRKCRTQTGKLK
jgi:photosystem II stability/assembly factor-like uncharacterized protein